ncbi:MAG: hypothetical protein V3T28_10770 [Gemmatimonadales bacterium]
MNCSEFLKRYSEVHDGWLRDARLVRRLEVHRRNCRGCSRWVELWERGVAALRQSPRIEPSPGFRAGLRQRLQSEVAIGDPIAPTHAGLAAAFLLAAALGLFLIEGLTHPEAEPVVAARAQPAAFPDSLDVVPEPVPVDVTIPAFGRSTLEFHSSQAPLGTLLVFSR